MMCPVAPHLLGQSQPKDAQPGSARRSAQPEWSDTELFLPGARRGMGWEQMNQFQIKYMPIQIGSHLFKMCSLV